MRIIIITIAVAALSLAGCSRDHRIHGGQRFIDAPLDAPIPQREGIELSLFHDGMDKAARRLLLAYRPDNTSAEVVHDVGISADVERMSAGISACDAMRLVAGREKENALHGNPLPLARLLDFARRNGFGNLHDCFSLEDSRAVASSCDAMVIMIEDDVRKTLLSSLCAAAE